MKQLGYAALVIGFFIALYSIIAVLDSAPNAEINVQLLDPPPGAIVTYKYNPTYGEVREMNIAFESQQLGHTPLISPAGEVIGFTVEAPVEGCSFVQITAKAIQTHWIGFFLGNSKHHTKSVRFQICAPGVLPENGK